MSERGDTARLVPVCRREEIAPGAMRRVEPDGPPAIAIYDVDGELYATADRCTHARASLCEGDLEGDEIVCPVHWGRFHVPTGKALGFPATRDLEVFDVVTEAGTVYLRLTEGTYSP